MTLHGETTGATYDKTVDYVGFCLGTHSAQQPEDTAPDASGYDNYWISAAGDYREDEFFYQLRVAVPQARSIITGPLQESTAPGIMAKS